MKLDKSQRSFCESDARYIRLLAPAGCGKTSALLHRCLYINEQAEHDERFRLVTFTKAAKLEAESRLATESVFAPIRDRVTVRTLNAYGYRRLRNELQNPHLLTSRTQRYFAMRNQLQPVWRENERLASAIAGRSNRSNQLMVVMDKLKALGFDHTVDTSLSKFGARLDSLQEQDLWPQMQAQIDSLTRYGIFDEDDDLDLTTKQKDRKTFYDRFFIFWRNAVGRLHAESTFTIEDQKYWCWLNLRSLDPDSKPKGITRFAHLLVDEFQDINPLDLALIKAIADRHQSSITIVGDDDQAIFGWRGATPEYILNPEHYFGVPFTTITLETNYRSPQNIVEYSQKLIQNNKQRVPKTVAAARGAHKAKIEIIPVESIGERLNLVSQIAKETQWPGRMAVIGRTRSQLIPYEVYYAADGNQIKTATDLDVFASDGFAHLMALLEIWDRRDNHARRVRALDDAMEVLAGLRKFGFTNKKDKENVRKHLQTSDARTPGEIVRHIALYNGPELRGKTPSQLASEAKNFINTDNVADAIRAIADKFSRLRYDFEKAEDDVWFVAPPLKQLADMAENEDMSAYDLIERLETAKDRVRHYQTFEDDDDEQGDDGQLLHLVTAYRAKGKEFDTVIVLDVNEDLWPHKFAETSRRLEEERRLFYVAFTRAQRRVVLLTQKGAPASRFIRELSLPSS